MQHRVEAYKNWFLQFGKDARLQLGDSNRPFIYPDFSSSTFSS